MKPIGTQAQIEGVKTTQTTAFMVVLVAVLVAVAGCSSTPPPAEDTDVVESPEAPESVDDPEPDDEASEEPARSQAEMEAPADEEIDDVDVDADDGQTEGEQIASHVDARIESALSAADEGDSEEAIESLRDLVDEPEGGFVAAYNLGVMYDRRGDLGTAMEYYVEALQRQPDFSPALQNVIRMYLRAGEVSEADEVARQFMDMRPDNLEHQAAHLEVWIAQGRYEDVVLGARDILRKDVANVDAMLQMATAKYQLRRFELAEAILERALQLSPQRADIFYLLAQVAWAQDNEEGARANFRQAIDLQPRFPEARNNYALLLHDAGNFERAIGQLEASIDDAPHDAQAHVNLGNSQKALGQYDAAEASYQRAMEIDERLGDAHFNLGILYLEANVPGYEDIERYELAIESFQRYRDVVGQREASESPVANYINQAMAAIEDEEERLEALRQAQVDSEESDDEGEEDSDSE